MNDGVIPASKGNAAQVFPAEHRQMVGRREACNRRHTCCKKHNTSFTILYLFCCLDNNFLFDLLLNGMINKVK